MAKNTSRSDWRRVWDSNPRATCVTSVFETDVLDRSTNPPCCVDAHYSAKEKRQKCKLFVMLVCIYQIYHMRPGEIHNVLHNIGNIMETHEVDSLASGLFHIITYIYEPVKDSNRPSYLLFKRTVNSPTINGESDSPIGIESFFFLPSEQNLGLAVKTENLTDPEDWRTLRDIARAIKQFLMEQDFNFPYFDRGYSNWNYFWFVTADKSKYLAAFPPNQQAEDGADKIYVQRLVSM